MTATGTTTFIPSQGRDGETAHINSTDSWRAPFNLPGVVSTYKGDVTGMAMITASGTEQPDAPSGQGYDSATFRDIRSGKQMNITRFVADAAKADDVPGLTPK
jgi:hypothetical protein